MELFLFFNTKNKKMKSIELILYFSIYRYLLIFCKTKMFKFFSYIIALSLVLNGFSFAIEFQKNNHKEITNNFIDKTFEYLDKNPSQKPFFYWKIKNKFISLKKQSKDNILLSCQTNCTTLISKKEKYLDEIYNYILKSLNTKNLQSYKDILNENKLKKISQKINISFYENLDKTVYELVWYNYDMCINFWNTNQLDSKCLYPFKIDKQNMNNALEIIIYKYNTIDKAKEKFQNTNIYPKDKKTAIDIDWFEWSILLKLDCYNKIRTLKLWKKNIIIDIKYNLNQISEKDIIWIAQNL